MLLLRKREVEKSGLRERERESERERERERERETHAVRSRPHGQIRIVSHEDEQVEDHARLC